MKRIVIISLLMSALALQAQDVLRVAYVDYEHLLTSMPEYVEAMNNLSQLEKNYETEYTRMQTEYNNKVKDYIANGKTLSEPIKLARQAEITECEDRMVIYKKRYTEELDKQKNAYLSPIRQKLSAAIKSVADAQHVSLVLDGVTPIYVAEPCVDLTASVAEFLKIE